MKLVLKNNGQKYQKNNYFSKNVVRNYLHRYPLSKILSMIDCKEYDKVLDAGCGDGILLPSLAAGFKKVYGSDIRPQYFKYIRKYKLKNVILKKDDIQKSKFKDNYFDLILCLEILEHMPCPNKAINEIKRILKEDGTAIISMPIETGLPFLLKFIGRFFLGYASQAIKKYSFNEFIKQVFNKTNMCLPRKNLGHKGFNHNILLKRIKKQFKIVNIKYLPSSVLGPNLSYRIILKVQKK